MQMQGECSILIIVKCNSCGKTIDPNVEFEYSRPYLPDKIGGIHLCIKCRTIRERKFEKNFKELAEKFEKLELKFKKLQKKYDEMKAVRTEDVLKRFKLN